MLKHGWFTFHLVSVSPWPFCVSMGLYMLVINLLCMFNHKGLVPNLMFGLSFLLSVTYVLLWFRDIVSESLYQGFHTLKVQTGLKLGFVLFIASEVMFFFSFFWGFFYYAISPSVEIYSWPPKGIETISPLSVPLLGTMLLISSGVTITWSHMALLSGKKFDSVVSLVLTLVMGLTFLYLQSEEYHKCSFTISDSVYGSIFYTLTGFHGLHVMLGTFMLLVCLLRMMNNHFSKSHHVGYEVSAWYWHFVDVVWLFLYVCVYWWSSN